MITLSQNSNGDYIVKGQKAGTANVKYFVKEEVYTLYSERRRVRSGSAKPSDVKSSPIIQITVTEASASDADTDVDAGADAADQPESDISQEAEDKAMPRISEA